MRFWDSSAVTPLLLEESDSRIREAQLAEDCELLVWYGTRADIESALNLRRRDGSLAAEPERIARRRLALLEDSWAEVEPTRAVRDRSLRLLRTQALRAADAFQLAAALAACSEQPQGFFFYTGDTRLREAAEMEGFTVC